MLLRLRARPNGFIEPCLPSAAPKPPAGSGWIHEIKHDGFRLMARRDAAGVRLFTRRGNDWTHRYPSIAAAVAALPCRSCLLDGEVVICGDDGIPCCEGQVGRCISTTTSRSRETLSSGTPASLVSRALCQSVSALPTARAERDIGSRARTRQHRQ
jgi:hypothetical protein